MITNMRNILLSLIYIILLINKIAANYKICSSNDDFNDAQIILMQSAEISMSGERNIKIYWHHRALKEGDLIAVYLNRPKRNITRPILRFLPKNYSGIKETNLKLSVLKKYPLVSWREECISYYAAWLRNGIIKKLTCLSTHPTWMHDRKNILKNKKLSNLFIPGTHMSGSYVKDLPRYEGITDKFVLTQNQDVLTQLIHGVRYLDFTPGIYSSEINEQKYWSYDGSLAIRSLQQIINDIKFFMEHTEEIVILCFRNFQSEFENLKNHRAFIDFIEIEFINYLLPRHSTDEWDITLGDIWNSERRLIICYDHHIQEKRLTLWSAPWAPECKNTDINGLTRFINGEEQISVMFSSLQETYGRELMRVMHVHLSTGINIDNSSHSCNNMTCLDSPKIMQNTSRSIADQITPMIIFFYNEKYYQTTNIVAVNFIDATGLIDIAITWNERKFSELSDCYESTRSIDTWYNTQQTVNNINNNNNNNI